MTINRVLLKSEWHDEIRPDDRGLYLKYAVEDDPSPDKTLFPSQSAGFEPDTEHVEEMKVILDNRDWILTTMQEIQGLLTEYTEILTEIGEEADEILTDAGL